MERDTDIAMPVLDDSLQLPPAPRPKNATPMLPPELDDWLDWNLTESPYCSSRAIEFATSLIGRFWSLVTDIASFSPAVRVQQHVRPTRVRRRRQLAHLRQDEARQIPRGTTRFNHVRKLAETSSDLRIRVIWFSQQHSGARGPPHQPPALRCRSLDEFAQPMKNRGRHAGLA
ncbi:hypothetical protein [Streptomyces longwoodensis]|uniref:hypothetical protein n=1 Tax=Streptomyces longwoodensis TaxID=68231 RepID=UPI0033F731D3